MHSMPRRINGAAQVKNGCSESRMVSQYAVPCRRLIDLQA